ncbi:DsbA family protein [Niallia sp. Krafla_26]|uniref:DsbA family protein n=1 Tax=Niallia sp. Krafla_26 TaxID=3064703 RepID=UPI003D172510
MVFAILIAGCQQDESKEEAVQQNNDTKYEDYVYKKYDLDVKDKVKLGEENAENSFVLAFDYSCPWCHKWMEEVLPVVQEKYIDTGKANYVGQPLVLLAQRSLLLSHVDYYMEKNQPEKLYDIQLRMTKEANNEGWGTEEYVQTTLKDYGVDISIEELEENNPDPISLTRNYTKNLDVQSVPTLYINGIKVYNAFNVDEIEQILNGEIKENDVIKVPVSE